MDRHEEAGNVVSEAMGIYQSMPERINDEIRLHQAMTLHTYGSLHNSPFFSGLNRNSSREKLEAALEICREIEQSRPGFATVDLAHGLLAYAIYLRHSYGQEEAIEAVQESIHLTRRIVETRGEDASYGIKRILMVSLTNLGVYFFIEGKMVEAEESIREALAIWRSISGHPYPLVWYGDLLRLSGRLTEALDVFRERLELVRPIPYGWNFVEGLLDIAFVLSQMSRFSEAEENYKEAIEICRKRQKEEEGSMGSLSGVLEGYAVLLRRTDRYTEAEECHAEAIEIRRSLAEREPRREPRALACALNNYGVLLRHIGRMSDAEDAYREAHEIARGLVAKNPKYIWMSVLVGSILNNLGVLLRITGRLSEAENVHNEALAIRKKFAEESPDYFVDRLAVTLNNLGVLLFESGKADDAEKALQESLDIRRNLLKKSKERYLPDLVSTLTNLGVLFNRIGREADMQNIAEELERLGHEVRVFDEWSEEEKDEIEIFTV
jgi:tetratricopeptide (TPR) repeat protein